MNNKISVGQIEFGEKDAKNEVFKEQRSGRSIFRASFRDPPGIDIDALLRGESYFILGQKGCGKTALMLYLQSLASERDWSTETYLFRTGISEEERQQILSGQSFSVLNFDSKPKIEIGYLYNWLWLIYSSILRRIEPDWLIFGHEILSDLKKLMKVNDETRVRAFDEMSVKRVAAKAKLGIKVPFVTLELAADIEAVKDSPKDRLPFEIVQIVERYLSSLRLLPNKRVMLFFDELELFWSKHEQRDRDLALIRDLLNSVSRANHALNDLGSAVAVYACIRSEVLEEINQISPELARDVEDFSVVIDWNVRAEADNQPILQIVEAKIQASEREFGVIPSESPWEVYFPEMFFGKNPENYLLDISMFKPRMIIMRLNEAKHFDQQADFFSEEAIEESTLSFSNLAWREVSEQMLHTFSQRQVSNIKELLTGWKITFTLDEVELRAQKLNEKSPGIIDGLGSRIQVNRMFKTLYENGAVGNRFHVQGKKHSEIRDRWAFRGHSDCAFNKPFVVHESLRKVFQLTYD